MLEIRLLGEMEVARDGERLALPPSRKTRALLAYLVLAGRPLRRDRLCVLLWDAPDDPKGALRWSLSKLRSLVDEPGRPRILASRESVAFEPAGARFLCRQGATQSSQPRLDRTAHPELLPEAAPVSINAGPPQSCWNSGRFFSCTAAA